MSSKNERLKKSRMEMKMTQGELAKEVGCTQSMISKIESGEKIPSDKVKVSISKVLKRSVEWLFFENKYD